MENVMSWLLQSDPWVEYRTRLDLLDQGHDNTDVIKARERMLSHPLITQMIDGFSGWEDDIVSNHKNAGLLIHRLSFLADIGLNTKDAPIRTIVSLILKHRSSENIIQVPICIPKHFGGTGEKAWGWALCDTPSVYYSLIKMGEKSLEQSFASLKELCRNNGWPCGVSAELGRFRGPGRKDDPCPYATLIMLKTLALMDEERNSEQAHLGAESLLSLWERSREVHPYIFYMGNDFRKLKVPFVWYDILHVAEVLTQFNWLKGDLRLREITGLIQSKADENGCYTPESIWTAWKGWEFCQKKAPSAWLTFLILRIFRRIQNQRL